MENREILSHWKNIPSNQLFRNLFSENVAFTKVSSKTYVVFHSYIFNCCVSILILVSKWTLAKKKISNRIGSSFYPSFGSVIRHFRQNFFNNFLIVGIQPVNVLWTQHIKIHQIRLKRYQSHRLKFNKISWKSENMIQQNKI